jgi:hypothetical protein
MISFTINSVNEDGTVSVTYDVDSVEQNISGLPVNDADALSQALADYGKAYEAGLALVAL